MYGQAKVISTENYEVRTVKSNNYSKVKTSL